MDHGLAFINILEQLHDNIHQMSPEPEIIPRESEIDPKWKTFEKELAKFKIEYKRENLRFKQKLAEYKEMSKGVTLARMFINERISNQGLKKTLVDTLGDYEQEQDLEEKKIELEDMLGKIRAMEKVLTDTNAEEFEKFRCFVCMDKYVNTFINPCGHLICSECLVRANTATCPGCRAQIRGSNRIFTLN